MLRIRTRAPCCSLLKGVCTNLYSGRYFQTSATFGAIELTSQAPAAIFVVHLTSQGNVDWATQAGGTSLFHVGNGIASKADGQGGSFVCGYFYGSASFGSVDLTSTGSSDIFVMHLDSSGDIVWAIKAGGSYGDSATAIAYDGATGGAFITGYYVGSASFGDTHLTSEGGKDAFVMHISSDGDINWVSSAGGGSYDGGNAIVSDDVGGAYVVGAFEGTATFGSTSFTSEGGDDIFAFHISSTGTIASALQAGGSSDDEANAVALVSEGAIVTGRFQGSAIFGSETITNAGDADAFVMHMDSSGAILWSMQAASGTGASEGYGIAADGAGGILLTGVYNGDSSFGTTSLSSSSSEDGFLARLVLPVPPMPPSPFTPSPSQPPPQLPPPSLPPSQTNDEATDAFVIQVELLARGDTADFDEEVKVNIAHTFADEAGVESSSVNVTVVSASVRILISITVGTAAALSGIENNLTPHLASASSMSALLSDAGVTVEATPIMTLRGGSVSPAPPASEDSTATVKAVAASAAVVMVLLLFVVAACRVAWRRWPATPKAVEKAAASDTGLFAQRCAQEEVRV